MKKIIFFVFIFLVACSGQIPQVTATSEAIATLLPLTAISPSVPTSTIVPTPAKEIITTPHGMGIELGPEIAGQSGVREIVDFVPPINAKDKPAFEDKFDPTTLGFGEGETQWVYIPIPDGKYRVVLQSVANPKSEIAEMGNGDVIAWADLDLMKEAILRIGKLVEMRGGRPIETRSLSPISNQVVGDIAKLTQSSEGSFFPKYITSPDGRQGVVLVFWVGGKREDIERLKKLPTSGYVAFLGKNGKAVYFYCKDFSKIKGDFD